MALGSYWLLLSIIVSLFHHACTSIGDRSHAYRQCTILCEDAVCDVNTKEPHQLALPLRLTFWSCEDDCSYRCMQNLTNHAVDPSVPYEVKIRALPGLPPNKIVQYHGKWPFYRFLGIQEPFSVLFSLANMYMHIKFGLSLRNRLPADLPAPLRRGLLVLPLAGINLWIWSTIFHIRDKPWTEKMDYFSAAASILCSLYVAIVRLAALYKDDGSSMSYAAKRKLLAYGLFAVFACHISYLTFWRFDYAYNMAFNVTIGLTHNLIWSLWSLWQYTLPVSPRRMSNVMIAQRGSTRAPHFYKPFLILTLLSSCTALELLDFPPILRCLDAHALWHASTTPIVRWWYLCLLEDAYWLVGRRHSAVKL